MFPLRLQSTLDPQLVVHARGRGTPKVMRAMAVQRRGLGVNTVDKHLVAKSMSSAMSVVFTSRLKVRLL
jgi:hypothetical protein